MEVILSNPPAQASTPRATCPGPTSKWFLTISKVEGSATSLSNVCQCSVNLTGQNCFLIFIGNLLCFRLGPLPLVLALGTTEKSLALSSFHAPFRYLYTLRRSPLSLPFSRLNSPSSQPFLIGEMLQSLHHLCGPSLDSLQYVHVSLVLRSPELDTVL